MSLAFGLGLGKGFWSEVVDGLMRPEFVVVDEIFEQLVGELSKIVEGCAVDQIVLERTPKALDLAVGLRSVRPGVTVGDAEFDEHRLEGVVEGALASAELGAVVGEELSKGDGVADVERIDELEGLEHDRQGLLALDDLGPGEP